MNSPRRHRDSNRSKLVIGLAGGIASGKSLVARFLGEMGALVIDSDEMVHRELKDPEVIQTYREWWGPDVCGPDGSVDRRFIAERVFEQPGDRERMERFLYPRLERRRREMISKAQNDPSVSAVVVNSPLLYEVGLDRECDRVIFVEADREERIRRAVGSRGWTEREFERRENLQKPLDMKRASADYTVVNDSSVDALHSQVKTLFDRLVVNHDEGHSRSDINT